MNRPVMYIIANQGLRMSSGKLASQVAHAAVRAAVDCHPNQVAEWLEKGETKIVLSARDNDHMLWAERYLQERGFRTWLVIDEGHTEIPPLSPTALAVPPVEKDAEQTKFAFESFKLYKDAPPEAMGLPDELWTITEAQPRKRWWPR